MQQYTAEEVAKAVSGKIYGKADRIFSTISVDSRTMSHSTGSVFFALRGRNRDGHSFIDELISKGIQIFVVDELYKESMSKELTFIRVSDTLEALQQFAAFIRLRYKGTIIGITGSNGKTVVKEWLYQVLRHTIPVFRSPLSYNSQIGVPLTLALLEEIYEVSVIEAGISLVGEMEKLEKIIMPDIGIITNLGEAHQQNFASHVQKLKEKLKLFKRSRLLIYCRDHELIHKTIEKVLPDKVRRVSWGSLAGSDYHITSIKIENKRTLVSMEGLDEKIIIPFTDKASIENAIHVFVLTLVLDKLKSTLILRSISKLEPVEMRLELLKGMNSCTLINDSYNSDIQSIRNSLELLMQQNQHKKKVVILSDIYQSGKSEPELYEDIALLVKGKKIDRFIGIGTSVNRFKTYFDENSLFFPDTKSFLRSGIWSGFHNMAILIKGSRTFEFENITGMLQEKQHQTVLEINLTSLISNLNIFRSLLNPSTRVMAMVKAFSYGSGSYEIANKLQFHKIDYLAAAFPDEGVELRKNGISLPIMIMNPDPSSFWTMVDYKLEPEIYCLSLLKEFLRFAGNNGLKSYPVHIKLDTGMHRLGFDSNALNDLLGLIPSELIEIVSVFSHLAAAEDSEHDYFTRKQIESYKEMCGAIKNKCERSFLMHILNSVGVSRFSDAQFDMVRLGIGLYGVKIADKPDLIEVSTFKTHISQLKYTVKGDTVGYGRQGKILGPSKIAVIPAGYADGIPRRLGNGAGRFLVNNIAVPVVGSVCMDMCMLDVTGIDVKEGDEVIIFGKGLSVKEIAKAARTIPYEILTGISGRVKRVYLEE